MSTLQSATRARREPSLRLVESRVGSSRPQLNLAPAPRPAPPVPADRVSLAALQAIAGELHALSAATVEAAAALLGGPAPAADAAVDAALRTVPRWHFAMLNDRTRNETFATALERRVTPGARVLDIGSGTGLLAMMAVGAGAAHVTTCEANPLLAELTREVVAAHGMTDTITVVAKRSTDLAVGEDLPVPADLVISEIVDCGLIGEGLLPTMRHAREHLLAPGGAMLPVGGRIIGCLVESSVIAKLNRVTTAGGFDVRLLNRFSTAGHFPVRTMTWPHRLLSAPAELVGFDLERDPLLDGSARVRLDADADGTAHGVIAWFELDLGAGVVLSNAPTAGDSHWMQAFMPWTDGLGLTAGQPVEVDLRWCQGRLTASAHTSTQDER